MYAAFLPLANILELAAETAMLCLGAALGYCDPRTLTLSGAEPRGALEEFRPTAMAAVPKVGGAGGCGRTAVKRRSNGGRTGGRGRSRRGICRWCPGIAPRSGAAP